MKINLEKLLGAEFKAQYKRTGGEHYRRGREGAICEPTYKIAQGDTRTVYCAQADNLELEIVIEEHFPECKIVCGNIRYNGTGYKNVQITLREDGKRVEQFRHGINTDYQKKKQDLLYALRHRIREVLEKKCLAKDFDEETLRALPPLPPIPPPKTVPVEEIEELKGEKIEPGQIYLIEMTDNLVYQARFVDRTDYFDRQGQVKNQEVQVELTKMYYEDIKRGVEGRIFGPADMVMDVKKIRDIRKKPEE